VYAQCEQVHVGNLAMSQHVRPIERIGVEQAAVGGPELVGRIGRRFAEAFGHLGSAKRAGIARLGHEADATAWGQVYRRSVHYHAPLQRARCARPGSRGHGKRLQQATRLLRCLLADRPGDIADRWRIARERGKH
jgi:hypothetical protein